MPLVASQPYINYRMMSLDPGLKNTGVAVFDLDTRSRTILSIDAFLLSNQRLINSAPYDHETVSERLIMIYKLKTAFRHVLEHYNPTVVVSEGPYYNPKSPMAYASLLEIVSMFRSVAMEYNSNILFHIFQPKEVKKVVGSGMNTGKLDMRDAVSRRPELMVPLMQNLNELDEHSIDAIAVGRTCLSYLTV